MTLRDARTIHDTAAERLAGLDQRYTRTRRALVELLAGAEAPLNFWSPPSSFLASSAWPVRRRAPARCSSEFLGS